MKKSIAMKWAKALRSGKYNQIKDQLQSENGIGYCCLGVLCDIAKKEGVKVYLNSDDSSCLTIVGASLRDQKNVSKWSGIHSVGQLFEKPKFGPNLNLEIADLAGANDNLNLTFDEIADIVENEWRNIK